MLKETSGLKFLSVTGYQGGSEVDLALERGEIQCRFISITIRFGREPYISWHQKALPAATFCRQGARRGMTTPRNPNHLRFDGQCKTPQLSRV